MSKFALDASALLALINRETGWEKVMAALPHSTISAVNLSECAAVLFMLGIPKEEITSMLDDLAPNAIPFDTEQAYLAAELRTSTKNNGLSLGDRACLALSKIEDLTALTADRIWKKIDCDIKIECIRG